jgi:hypothetical protein
MQGQILLVALIVPGSVEAELGRVQAGVFSEHGLVSAAALPPLIPIAFVPGFSTPDGLLAALNRSVRAPWRITVGHAAWMQGSLYVSVDSGGMWDTLRGQTLALCGTAPDAPFVPAEGFFLGCGDASPAEREAIHPAVPPLAFSSADAAILRLDLPSAGMAWWREVYWEFLEQKPLRGRREQ